MIDTVKAFAQLTAKAISKWLMIVLFGTVITAIFFIIIIFQNSITPTGEHGAVYSFIVHLFSSNICGFVLFAGAPVFVVLYFIIGHKMAIQSAIYLLWKNKAEAFIGLKVKTIIDDMISRNETVQSLSNEAVLKIKLLDAVKNDKESSAFKRSILRYMFSRVQLDNIDFSNEDLKLSDIISERLNIFISGIAAPSLFFFRLLLAVQIMLFVAAQFFKG